MRTPYFPQIVTTAAALLAAATVGAGAATAAPVPTQQTPARATGISGMLIPSIYPVPVNVDSTATPGTVALSAPASQAACATTIGRALVRVSWRNTTTGHSGSVTIKPCSNGYNPGTPTSATVTVGKGRTTFGSTVLGSRELPTAGQPAFPGSGAFTAG